MDECRILAPTGTLGYGFSRADFQRCIADFKPNVIAVDAGSTDPGPYYLGAGVSFTSETEIASELQCLIAAGVEHRIPVIVGSAGGCGATPHLDWTVQIVKKLAKGNGWRLRIATVGAELSQRAVLDYLRDGRIREFESETALDDVTVRNSSPIVAQMGNEPIMKALEEEPDVVIAGRSCDDVLFSAYPILHGFDRGLATHMGKILECGALAASPPNMDIMLGTIRRDHFDLEPGSRNRRCTVASVAGHSLYERENPVLQAGPGGLIDLTSTRMEQVNDRVVRVTGTRYVPAQDYTVKLEGVRSTGFRTICIAGVSCPAIIANIDEIFAEAIQRTQTYMEDAGVPRSSYRVAWHIYGKNGVMGPLQPPLNGSPAPHELGLVIDVVGTTQELSHAVCHHLSGCILHLDFRGQISSSGNLAFPYSPSELDAGAVYEFSIYHLLKLNDPLEIFPIERFVAA